jgi:hypothetical protein
MSDRLVYTYLDTSALMRRAEAAARSRILRVEAIAPVIAEIFADPARRFACSELTLLELHSNLTANLRSSANGDWDLEWWQSSWAQLMDDVAQGRIVVLAPPPKGVEHVMSLVELATREHGRALRAWDAMHAVVAGRWAYELGSGVVVLTADGDFDALLAVTDFGARLTIENLDVMAETGEGFDRRNRDRQG